MLYISELILIMIPIAAIAFFIVSLVLFCAAKKGNKLAPGSYSENQIKVRGLLLIISSVIAGVLMAIVIGVVVLMSMALAYM